MIDWSFALATGTRLSRPGPEIGASEAAEVVAELREGAALSEEPVRQFADLHARSATAPVLVVDRPRWIEANLETFETILEPAMDQISAKAPGPVARAIGSKVGGAEIGSLMAFMSTKVLGQFDPFWEGPAGETGRLLLVAPNIVHVERQLEVDPHDFRLWVCLHEETHRVQFTAVPWMRDHLRGLMDDFVESTDLDPAVVAAGLGELVKVVRGQSDRSLGDLFQNETQREVVDRITGVMSLLEGHADVVMDGVGPDVIASVAQIRRKFDQRRQGSGGIDRLIRRLLGLEGKMRQYRDGAVFVRHAVDTVGLEGFNAVWASAENLPTRAEILEPDAWVRRVHA
ncbi:coenzyme F420 biosynthesis-associated protein [Aeromicrobium marinum DSM 15272]|uniref:Coenzyme F420 biosynthesis-associated protein n=1 Tax=Aeromicrobium marinum DSM 15272 TaxID=585531 RepID=E2SC58_9ACTN|nr:zinc-dependent metalloprotease [Aeromicrobium marinum]EFQ83344.1 coenzyme F420 biosynthesis-associated protein [Aeromicrobium marinum DSM 15272]